MKTSFRFFAAIAVVLGTAASAQTAAPGSGAPPVTQVDARNRVTAAVDAFDYATVVPIAQFIFNPQLLNVKPKKGEAPPTGNVPNIGAGIQAMLIDRLSQGGRVSIFDKDKVEEIKKMQEDGLSGRNKQGAGARPGGIRTPDVLVAGSVVTFGRDDKEFGISTAIWPYRSIAGAFNKKEFKAVVKVTYKVIDGDTAIVIASGEAEGSSTRKSKGIAGMAATNGAAGGAGLQMGSTNFAQTIIGEATQDCVNHLADALNEQFGKTKPRVRRVDARVAAVDSSSVTINVGTNDGVNVGDIFEISHTAGEVKDPVTGEVLSLKLEKKGEMTVTEVDERSAVGSYAGMPAEKMDVARRRVGDGK